MADTSGNAKQARQEVEETASASLMVVISPQENTVIEYLPGLSLEFVQDISNITLNRDGYDLLFTFPDGQLVTLKNFFDPKNEEILGKSIILLPDGEEINLGDVFQPIDVDGCWATIDTSRCR